MSEENRALARRFYQESFPLAGKQLPTTLCPKGTHKGEFRGLAATGKEVTVNGMTFLRFAGGRIVEFRAVADQRGMMRQLGASSW
jgi:predicted ester cyclase